MHSEEEGRDPGGKNWNYTPSGESKTLPILLVGTSNSKAYIQPGVSLVAMGRYISNIFFTDECISFLIIIRIIINKTKNVSHFG